MREVQIYGVSFDMVGKQPIVLLKTIDDNRYLPIWIGHPEAAAILMKLDVKQSGLIMNEMKSDAAAKLTAIMASAARKEDPS